ncbi:MAG: CDP-glucose 4,6-dehydratase [Synergistaceae bacterium]
MDFYKGKKVLLTGHTGFKGAWLTRILLLLGADVTGYSLEAPTTPSLFEMLSLKNDINNVIGDIRDYEKLNKTFIEAKPEIVIHLAAQPLVRESYTNPRYTYETNVMGTVNILECIRATETVMSFLNVTTDKVYENKEWEWGYRENESLNGYDPYSNSKSCSELVTSSYKKSFFSDNAVAISTARAGNVIGGGDFSVDRIIPDCIRFALNEEEIVVRNPFSTRPYQYVLEPLYAYLLIAMKQYEDTAFSGSYNVGPEECDCVRTGELVDIFCKAWGDGVSWKAVPATGPHEANFLKLDCSKIKKVLGWMPKWRIDTAIKKTVDLTKTFGGSNLLSTLDRQIFEYLDK